MMHPKRARAALVVAVCLATAPACLGRSSPTLETGVSPQARPLAPSTIPTMPAATPLPTPALDAADVPVDMLWSCADATLGRLEGPAERCARG